MLTVYGFTDWFTFLAPKIGVFFGIFKHDYYKQFFLVIISSPITLISVAHATCSVIFILFGARNRYLCRSFVFDTFPPYDVIIPGSK